MKAVVDTNVIVSGLLSSHSPPAQILQAIEAGRIEPIFCEAMLREYLQVLIRPRFGLPVAMIAEFLKHLGLIGVCVEPEPLSGDLDFPDDADVPFYMTAVTADCVVITGNMKHYPHGGPVDVLSPREVVDSF